MLTLAGQPLAAPTPEALALITRDLDPSRVQAFLRRGWPGFGAAGLAYPTGYRQDPPPRIGCLSWPRGASRWAHGLYLCGNDGGQLDAIRDAAFGDDGTKATPVRLHIDAPDASTGRPGEALDAEVYLLAAQPLYRLVTTAEDRGSVNPLYLLHVVDERYSWWDTPTPDFGIFEGSGTTWGDVFAAIYDALDIGAPDVSTISPDYLLPARALNLTHEALPLVFDAAAWNVGMHVVRDYDGTVSVQSFADARDSYDQDQQDNPGRPILAGDVRFQDYL